MSGTERSEEAMSETGRAAVLPRVNFRPFLFAAVGVLGGVFLYLRVVLPVPSLAAILYLVPSRVLMTCRLAKYGVTVDFFRHQ